MCCCFLEMYVDLSLRFKLMSYVAIFNLFALITVYDYCVCLFQPNLEGEFDVSPFTIKPSPKA